MQWLSRTTPWLISRADGTGTYSRATISQRRRLRACRSAPARWLITARRCCSSKRPEAPQFDLVDAMHAGEAAFLAPNAQPAHKFEVRPAYRLNAAFTACAGCARAERVQRRKVRAVLRVPEKRAQRRAREPLELRGLPRRDTAARASAASDGPPLTQRRNKSSSTRGTARHTSPRRTARTT